MPKATPEEKPSSATAAESGNWLTLASHLQAKVLKRTSDVSYLQTRAGFLIAAAVIVMQIISSLPKFTTVWPVIPQICAGLAALSALILSIISMHIGKSTTPLNPDEMILHLTERPTMTSEDMGRWLSKSYSLANKAFNTEYNRKYKQQVAAAILLVISLATAIIIKGVNNYVGH